MSQKAISSYFATRKRGAGDDLIANKSKVLVLDQDAASAVKSPRIRTTRATQKLTFDTNFEEKSQAATPRGRKRTISGKSNDDAKTPKTPRMRARKCLTAEKCEAGMQQTKLVDFVIKGLLSPKKMQSPVKDLKESEGNAFGSKDNGLNAERGMQTPVKQKVPAQPRPSTARKQMIKDLPLEKIKERLGKSDRVTELKTRLNNIQQGLDRFDRMEGERKEVVTPKKKTIEIANQPKSLKKFDQLEVEVLR